MIFELAINILVPTVIGVFFLWASSIRNVLRSEGRRPLLCDFLGNIFRRLGLGYLYKNKEVIVALNHLLVSFAAFADAILAAKFL